MKRIFSPYRICPIGAHVDHQGGLALGRTIQLGTSLEYEAVESNEMHIHSDQFGEAHFVLGDEIDKAHWARYAQAAGRVLPHLKRGIKAHVQGALIGSGLSSSASVGLAYLKALADVNEIDLSLDELVHLDFDLENGQLGLQNGILDPLTIVHGKKDALLFMDTKTGSVSPISDPPDSFAWIIAYSGVSRELTKSGFNVRVTECYEAAAMLKDGAQKLSDIPLELFEEGKTSLPDHLRKRAEHFFGEVERVKQAAKAWEQADFKAFGNLMNESCQSSIQNYESGSDVLIQLHQIVSEAKGVYGSRFSGGGYGGCVVALAEKEKAENACAQIAENFSKLHLELPSRVFIPDMGNGLQ